VEATGLEPDHIHTLAARFVRCLGVASWVLAGNTQVDNSREDSSEGSNSAADSKVASKQDRFGRMLGIPAGFGLEPELAGHRR
jgi:hypothetical protein